MRRRLLPILLPMAALAAIAWLFWDELEASGALRWIRRSDEAQHVASSSGRSDALAADLEYRARLGGLPGVQTELRGTGRLTGAVKRYVSGAGPRPLSGIEVRVVGAGQRGGMPEEVRTLDDGTFAFDELAAHVGYAVIVDHPPFKEVVLRGVNVERDRTTDVGTILLGAPTSLRGEVVDGAGRPLPGVSVQVFPDRSRPRRFDWRRSLFELQSATAYLSESHTGRNGAFLVDDLPPGRYVLRISAGGYATVFREGVWVTADERAPSLRVVLDPGAGYRGRVLDEAGRGIANARVIAVAVSGSGRGRLDRVETTSDARGVYRLDVLVAGDRYFVEAWAEGFAPAGRIVQPEGLDELDFVLARSGRVEGRVTDAVTGAGIEGAQVTLVAGTVNTLSPVSAVTDGDGHFALPHVSVGPIVVFAAKADGYPAGSFDIGSGGGRSVKGGKTTVIDWALDPGRVVVGRVLDDAGHGVAYATVAFAHRKRRSDGEETALTQSDGSFRIEGLHPGSHEVRITAPGFAPLTTDEEARLDVPETPPETLHDFVLARGAILQGTVSAPDGAPASGARLQVTASGSRRLRDRVQDLVAVTAVTGRWRIPGVPPGVDVVVEARHDDWVETASGALRLRPGEERQVDLTLRSGIRLVGKVEDVRGSPLGAARVRWGAIGPDDERQLGDAFRADQLLTARVVRADADGAFVLDHLPPGRVLVKVEKEGYSDWYRKDLVLLAQGPRPDLRVTMQPAGRVQGTVRDAQTRRPLADAWVYAREEEPGEDEPPDDGRVRSLVSTQTGADGRYLLEGIPPDRKVEIVVWLALGYVGEAQDRRDPSVRKKGIAPGASGVDFALKPEGWVEPEGE